REEFVEQVTAIVRDRFPLVKIGESDGSFALSINGSVAPLENLYRVAVLRPDELQRHVERWAVELLRAAEGTPDEDATYDEVKDRIMPMILPASATQATPGIVHEPLIPGLIVGYAIDHDRTISYLPILKFQEWGITMEQLRETAMNNLTTRSEAISAHAAQDEAGRVNLILFQTMDGYDASRLLLPTLHNRLREHLGSPFAAGIPNRDILLCFRNDSETADRLAKQIAEDYQRMPHQVTDQLILVTQDGIAPREAQPES
ncbi:MAG TPA: DUF1444 family protein, partial [Tepidisphaeraceae bacterium]